MKKVLVVGSVNIDHVYMLNRMPVVGETLEAKTSNTFFGGKGANQAVASSLFGADTAFLGAVGEDQYKQSVVENFQKTGVNVDQLQTIDGTNTGTAVIFSVEGDNSIIIEAGANQTIDEKLISDQAEYIQTFDIVLIQNEIPESAIRKICELKTSNQVFIYNPAPFRLVDQGLLNAIDYITPNELEYQSLIEAGIEIEKAKLIITQGANGVAYNDVVYPAETISPIDTTGAGDCFNGVLAACLSNDYSIEEAIEWSVKAATISTLTLGAQNGYKSKIEIAKR